MQSINTEQIIKSLFIHVHAYVSVGHIVIEAGYAWF